MSISEMQWIGVTPKDGKGYAYIRLQDIHKISFKEHPAPKGNHHLFVSANGEEFHYHSYASSAEAEKDAKDLMKRAGGALVSQP